MFLFHIEDENGLNPVERSYGKLEPIEIPSVNVDRHIADEIGAEVNGKKSRKIFSCSKSLGICLFKYNLLADNPLHIINLDRKPKLNTVIYKKRDQYQITNYNIASFNYPRERKPPKSRASIVLLNYIIDVSNNDKLDQYLRYYTTEKKGKKARVSMEKDKEVVMRHIDASDVIKGDYEIAALYLLYALQYKTGFLTNEQAFDAIYDALYSDLQVEAGQTKALHYALLHMTHHIKSERDNHELIRKYAIGQPKVAYDAYDMAYDIIVAESLDDETLRNINNNRIHFIVIRGLIDRIWEIFLEWRSRP